MRHLFMIRQLNSLLDNGFGRLLFYGESHLFSIFIELILPTFGNSASWRPWTERSEGSGWGRARGKRPLGTEISE